MTATTQSPTPAPAIHTLHPQGMSRANQLLPLLPFGKTTLYDWVKAGKFPAPIRLSDNMTAWRNSDVLAWFDNLTPTASKHRLAKDGGGQARPLSAMGV